MGRAHTADFTFITTLTLTIRYNKILHRTPPHPPTYIASPGPLLNYASDTISPISTKAALQDKMNMPCTRRSPACLVGRIPPAEAVDGEISIPSAWASSNLGYAYLSLRCSHLLVSRLYTDHSIANFWEMEGGRRIYLL